MLLTGCEKDGVTFTTGVVGIVKYGQGDCMPSPDPRTREYSDYDGEIFFIVKEDFDKLGNGDLALLKNNSIHFRIKQGKLAAELPVGTYLVLPADVYVYSEGNTITINTGEILDKDFAFFKCTSY
jgi:hypothetical protein